MNNALNLPPKVTDRAFARLAEINGQGPARPLRVAVAGGGCSGFSYGFDFAEELGDDDTTFDNGSEILVEDSLSYQYLVGSTIDYTEGLEGSRFIVNNPSATTTCGCGSSFSI